MFEIVSRRLYMSKFNFYETMHINLNPWAWTKCLRQFIANATCVSGCIEAQVLKQWGRYLNQTACHFKRT